MSNALVFPPVTSAFRDWPSPTFLLGPNGSRYNYSMRIMWDALGDAMTYAVLARYPTTCPPDALQWIGQDRQIDAGYQETTDAYRARLIQWLDLWGYAGLPTSVLLAMLAYVTPALIQVTTVDNTGNWSTYPAGSIPFPAGQQVPTPPTQTPRAGNWQWDGLAPAVALTNGDPNGFAYQWWRMWVILFSTGGVPWAAPSLTWAHLTGSVTVSVVSDAVYGTAYQGSGTPAPVSTDFNWDGGNTGAFQVTTTGDTYLGHAYLGVGGPLATFTTPAWDWSGSVQQAADLVIFATKWRRAGCWIPNVIVCYDSTFFQPTSGSSKLPDGEWGHWNKVSTDATYGKFYDHSRPVNTTCSILSGAPVTIA